MSQEKGPIGHRRNMRTNIERRACQRIVPMEVLCLGMSRTGTSSMREALFQLGYYDVYHGVAVVHENPRDCEMWLDAYKACRDGEGTFGRKEWDQLLGHCMVVTDDPCASFAKELVEAYPDAKVVLTIRDSPEAWCKSVERTIWKWGSRWWAERGIFYNFYLWLRGANNPLFLMTKRSWYESGFHEFPTRGEQLYLAHNEYVKSMVPEDRLLVFNVKEGWELLCAFLGKEVPSTSFPKINDSEEFQRRAEAGNRMLRRRALVNGIKLLVGIGVVAAVGVAWLARLKLLSRRSIQLTCFTTHPATPVIRPPHQHQNASLYNYSTTTP